jgi:hypothetical protein
MTAGSGGTMNVGSGFFGFLTLGGSPLAARRLARMRFLYCFQSQAKKIMAQMVMTAALETMAETMGVLARWLFLSGREKWVDGGLSVSDDLGARAEQGGLVQLVCWEFRKLTYPWRRASSEALLSTWKWGVGPGCTDGVAMEYDVEEGESRKEDEPIGRKPERILPRSYDLYFGNSPHSSSMVIPVSRTHQSTLM